MPLGCCTAERERVVCIFNLFSKTYNNLHGSRPLILQYYTTFRKVTKQKQKKQYSLNKIVNIVSRKLCTGIDPSYVHPPQRVDSVERTGHDRKVSPPRQHKGEGHGICEYFRGGRGKIRPIPRKCEGRRRKTRHSVFAVKVRLLPRD